MEPSAQFLKNIASNQKALRLIERSKKEFEIFNYLSDIVPKKLTDSDWSKVLETKSVDERVSLWNFLAIAQKRDEEDKRKKDEARQKTIEIHQQQEEIFNKGGMAYGSGLYRMMLNPFAQAKSKTAMTVDINHYVNSKLRDMPQIAYDLQFIPDEVIQNRGRLATNFRYALTENRDSKFPFPISLVNANSDEPNTQSFFDNVGMLNNESESSFFTPPIYKNNPLLLDNQKGEKEIIYISRYARDMLDGPLTHDAYIIPMTFDHQRQSLAAGRKANFRVMSLPFKKYVKWQSGPMFLPILGIYRVFETVSKTGGDWHRALTENISKRHLVTHEENRMDKQVHKDVAKFRFAQRKQVTAAIKEALGE